MLRTYHTNEANQIKAALIFHLVCSLLLVVVLVLSASGLTADGRPPFAVLVLLSFLILLLAWREYRIGFRSWHQIQLSDDGICEFQGLRSRRVVSVDEITSIRTKVTSGQERKVEWIVIRYRGGKVDIPQRFEGCGDFLARLEQLNPGLGIPYTDARSY
jgi:hypothetical protein